MSGLIVAAAQSASVRGNLDANIAEHVRLIVAAASAGAGLVVFPELSLTGYELDLAAELQMAVDDQRLGPVREAAREHDMHVLAGGPWASDRGKPYLGAFLLSADGSSCYAKIHVHETEQDYFLAGKDNCVVPIGCVPVGLAICADTGYETHAANNADLGAELYVASVMVTESGYRAHADKLALYAARHGMAVLAANYANASGGFDTAGKSAFWSPGGKLLAQAPSSGTALVVARREGEEWDAAVIVDP